MKWAALIFAVLCSAFALAGNRDWKDAKVVNISSENGGAIAAPVGTMMVGIPITKTFYWIQTDGITYILGPAMSRRQLLNVTLNGQTKIAIDGHNAHILDDDGKDKKMRIAEKIARPKADEAK
jgi:hypothetical protein